MGNELNGRRELTARQYMELLARQAAAEVASNGIEPIQAPFRAMGRIKDVDADAAVADRQLQRLTQISQRADDERSKWSHRRVNTEPVDELDAQL